METLTTLITVTAGMTFSLAVAILVEEWIFGKVFVLFFSHQAARVNRVRSANARPEEICCS
jgi:hypothetical protein